MIRALVPTSALPFAAILIVLLALADPSWAQPDPIEKELPRPASLAGPEAGPTDQPRPRILELVGSAAGAPESDWSLAYRVAPGAERSAAAELTLRLARDQGLDRATAVQQLKDGGDATKNLIKNLDVGRHDLLKWLYARAMTIANQELAQKKKSPLRKVLTVNSGGTGDYTRDQDITAFAGDEVTEEAFFRGLVAAADEAGLKIEPKASGGIDLPQIEVTLFPGRNDLPDSRFGTDMGEFQLAYIKGVHKQLSDVEAYIGGGADLEVKGRRRPGQVYAQELTLQEDGGLHYRSEVPGNLRETKALFDIEPRSRPEAWQKAAHIFNDLLQGYRHSLHGDDATKGPLLKYSGRAIDYLCSLKGKNPWKDLQPDERRAMLKSLFPGQSVPDAVLVRMEDVISIADEVVRPPKKLPARCKPETDQKIALIFLKKALAASAGEMARQALHPPRFEEGWLTPAERARWDALSPAERHEEALKRDRTYRENFSNEAYENLIVTLAMLRRIDIEEAKKGNAFHGEAAIRQMIETAEPHLRGVLEDASEYAKLYMELQAAPSGEVREKVRQELPEARKKLAGHLDDSYAPSARLLEQMKEMGPRAYIEREMKGRPALPSAAVEIKDRFTEHLRQAFPTTAEEFRNFSRHIEIHGVQDYAVGKMKAELFQLDTIADALSLVEMYQRGATRSEYGWFIAVNLLSRVHWSFGQLYQASQVRTEEDIEALGQNLVFATLSRVVPWAATAKIVFDIGKGLVTVTVGYSINVVNADLVDALYTGAAGRPDDDAAGTAAGALRDSGFCILKKEQVLWLTNEKTKARERAIDRPEVYRHFFRLWAGVEPEEVPEYGKRKGSLAQTHDELVHIMWREWANHERTWVSTDARKPFERMLESSEVEEALRRFDEALARQARLAAQKVAADAAVREYKSYFDSEDVIVKGLADRFTADLHMGFLTWWQSYMTAQMMAMREVERTAMQADCAGYAQVIRENIHQGIVAEKPDPQRPAPTYRLRAELQGLRPKNDEAFDGSQPVRVVANLEGCGEVGERCPEVVIRVTPGKLRMVRKAGEKEDLLEPGDLVEQDLLVQALADQGRGAELARQELTALVRIPDQKPDDGSKIYVRRHTERNSRDEVVDEFSYIERFPGMPSSWPTEDGYVMHGRRELLRYGSAKEVIEYEYGQRSGLHEVHDGKGRWVIRETFKDGKEEGLRVHRDPDSQARHETDYHAGEMQEDRTYHENGQMSRRLTYDRDESEDPEKSRCKGSVEAWWSNGNQRFKGVYDAVGRGAGWIRDFGGSDGETVEGRQGQWLWYHMNGQLDRRGLFRDGLLHGPFEAFDENGQLCQRGNYVSGQMDGEWYFRAGGQGAITIGHYQAGKRHGRFDYCDGDGKKLHWEDWVDDRQVDSGRYED